MGLGSVLARVVGYKQPQRSSVLVRIRDRCIGKKRQWLKHESFFFL